MKASEQADPERAKFFHRLRLIFTYYSSIGNKQDPLVLRQKSFQKFLLDSTISQLVKVQNKSSISNGSKMNSSRIQKKSKQYEVIVNTFNKPLHYEQFQKTITELIFQIRHEKKWEEVFEQVTVQKDLYTMCKQDKIVQEIFSYLYQEISEYTEFGKIVRFSKRKELFSEQAFTLLIKYHNPLRTVYTHYFSEILRKETNTLDKIFLVIKKFAFDFQITPKKLSLTEIFVILWELNASKTKSVYEQLLEDQNLKKRFFEELQLQKFNFISFNRLLIVLAHSYKYKISKNDQFEIKSSTIIQFFEFFTTTKGYKSIKSSYKMNDSLFIRQNTNSPLNNDSIDENSQEKNEFSQLRRLNNLDFQPKPINESKAFKILKLCSKIIRLIFENYSQKLKQTKNIKMKHEQQLVNQNKFNFFCSQFKIVPNIISKRQVGQLYMRIFFERQYFYLNPSQRQDGYIERKTEQNKLKLYEMISRPEYGLTFQEFQKFLLYLSEIDTICTKFNSQERLIYLIEHLLSQSKFRILVQKLQRDNRVHLFLQKDFKLKEILIKQNSNSPSLDFEGNYETMYRKLKNSLK